MKIPKYWAQESKSVQDPRGKWLRLAIWQWSDESAADARQQALARVNQLLTRVQSGETLNRYSYGERPLREEILEAVTGDRGQEVGVITRNAYGAAVLNAANAMFIDIDFKEESGPSLSAQLQKLRGPTGPNQEQRALAKLEEWAARNVGLGLRVYRTAGGLRGLITNELFDPTQESALAILRDLESDPLYIRMCRQQGCFRARLSAKPWRCGMRTPPSKYPWENAANEQRFRAWEEKYKAAASRYTACRLLKQIGNPEVHPDIAPVLAAHDQRAATGGLALA